jgi:hypothetical protein
MSDDLSLAKLQLSASSGANFHTLEAAVLWKDRTVYEKQSMKYRILFTIFLYQVLNPFSLRFGSRRRLTHEFPQSLHSLQQSGLLSRLSLVLITFTKPYFPSSTRKLVVDPNRFCHRIRALV